MEEYIKSFGKQKSGNGVYVVRQGMLDRVVIVYGNGFMVDYPIQYDNGTIVYNEMFIHSETTKMLTKRAYRFLNKVEA